MARGQNAEVGATRISANGYSYTKVDNDGTGRPGWRLTHHLVAEKKLGRPLRGDERVVFIGSKRDLSPGNIKVVERGRSSVRRRLAQIEARIADLEAEKAQLQKELAGPVKINHNV